MKFSVYLVRVFLIFFFLCRTQAKQQMEESLLAGRGIVFYRILEAVPFQGSGDKIKLPPSCFTELSNQGAFD